MMKKINDSKIYLAMVLVPLVIAAAVGGVSLYSRFKVEPKIKSLISSESTMKEGYILLREPQIFGGYTHWESDIFSDGQVVKNSLIKYDDKVFNGEGLNANDRIYLERILMRRISGSELGIKSAIFLLIVSLTCFAAYLLEAIKNKKING